MESTDADNVHTVHYSAVYLYFQPHFVAVHWQGGSKTIKPAGGPNKQHLWVQTAELEYDTYNAKDIIKALRLCFIMQSYP